MTHSVTKNVWTAKTTPIATTTRRRPMDGMGVACGDAFGSSTLKCPYVPDAVHGYAEA
jgi:hypothetical protein